MEGELMILNEFLFFFGILDKFKINFWSYCNI